MAADFYVEETAVAVADAVLLLCEGDTDAALREFRQLRPALRRNSGLRGQVLVAGPLGADAVVRQDRREWATAALRDQRRRWALEALREAVLPPEVQNLLAFLSACGRNT